MIILIVICPKLHHLYNFVRNELSSILNNIFEPFTAMTNILKIYMRRFGGVIYF